MKRLAFLLLAACSSSSTLPDGSAMMDGPGQGSRDGDAALYCPAGTTLTPYKSAVRKASFAMADQVLDSSADYFAVLETDVGRLVLDLYEAQAPITVNSFVFLALNHFYDGVAFHRVIEGFVAQGGDPNSVDGPPGTWG